MARGPEHIRGDMWKRRLMAEGWWVQKLPGSSLSGIPDYIRGHVDHGLVFTEAKTMEAVLRAKRPTGACSRAQVFFLDQLVRYRATASLLVLDDVGYLDVPWVSFKGLDRQWMKSVAPYACVPYVSTC